MNTQDEIVSVMSTPLPLPDRNLEEVRNKYSLIDRKFPYLSANCQADDWRRIHAFNEESDRIHHWQLP